MPYVKPHKKQTPFILKVAFASQLIDMVFLDQDENVSPSSMTASVFFSGRNSARLDTIYPFNMANVEMDDIVNANPRPNVVSIWPNAEKHLF